MQNFRFLEEFLIYIGSIREYNQQFFNKSETFYYFSNNQDN